MFYYGYDFLYFGELNISIMKGLFGGFCYTLEMKDNQTILKELKDCVTERSANPDFIHHHWFITYHVDIVEAISLELCNIYKQADQFKVLALTWLHDYEKIVDFDNQYNTELLATTELM